MLQSFVYTIIFDMILTDLIPTCDVIYIS